ncbi:MAG: hypothetical protein IJ228_14150 [Succinivibrio sp.]|nr:hypothetical protein [Succinivibrio sp.]
MLIARMVLECQTPLHCGGGEDLLQDSPVVRDGYGFWRIQGSSIAGALRSELAAKDKDAATRMFGSMEDNERRPSLVWCSDGVLLDYDGQEAWRKEFAGRRVEINTRAVVRDHVRLDELRGVAVRGGKFDEELVPKGARFAVELKYDGWDLEGAYDDRQDIEEERSDRKARAEQFASDRRYFLELCSKLRYGLITIGGKRVSGFGRVKCPGRDKFQLREFNLQSSDGMLQWLSLQQGVSFAEGVGAVVDPDPAADTSDCSMADNTVSLSIDKAVLITQGPILVGGINEKSEDSQSDIKCMRTPVFDYDAPDGQQKGNSAGSNHMSWRYTIPGSSLRGALRHRLHDIAAILMSADKNAGSVGETGNPEDPHKKVMDFLGGIFGTVKGDGSCGKVEIEDIYLRSGVKSQQVQHVALDRFTGGALDGALFDERPVWLDVPLELEFKMRATDLSFREALLLGHALADLFTGTLPVGGGVNRGNGVVKLNGVRTPRDLGAALLNVEGRVCCRHNGVTREITLPGADPGDALKLIEELETAGNE